MAHSLTTVTEYIADREALLIQIDLSDYLIDYYLHRRDLGEVVLPAHDEQLKQLITCFAAHLTIHRPIESHAWTVHMIAEPPYSLFVTGGLGVLHDDGSASGYLVGNILTDHIRHTDVNSLHAQFTDSKGGSFKSYVKSEHSSIAGLVEHFYEQSEQQALRIALSETSDTAIALVALPGYDREWFHGVELVTILENASLTRKPMRRCRFDFVCDCSPEKLLPFFRSLTKEGVDDLYGADEELIIVCPRCGRRFAIGRGAVEGI